MEYTGEKLEGMFGKEDGRLYTASHQLNEMHSPTNFIDTVSVLIS